MRNIFYKIVATVHSSYYSQERELYPFYLTAGRQDVAEALAETIVGGDERFINVTYKVVAVENVQDILKSEEGEQ